MTARLTAPQQRVVDSMRAQVLEAGLHEVNAVRGDIGLPPLAALVPAPLDRTSDEPEERCIATTSILAGAGPEWACVWEGWDKLQITGPGVDLLLVVPACTELTLWWARDDLPGLALPPEERTHTRPPFLTRETKPTRQWGDAGLEVTGDKPGVGEQLSLLGAAA